MDNLLPIANPILATPFEFIKPKYDYPGDVEHLPYFHSQQRPPKDVLNFECCDIDFFQKEPTFFTTLHELHNNSTLVYQRFVTSRSQNFASPQYQGTHLFSKGPVHFNSNFECGNLYTAYKVAEKKFNLILHNDTQTNGCTRWYFFSVRTPERMMLQFNILNLTKSASHLSVNPFIYTARTGWYRGGENVQYYKNHYQKKQDYFYTLSFSYLFEKDDITYFSLYPPYGITSLQQFLKPLNNIPCLKLKALQNNQSNQYPVLTIGDSTKPLIVIIARQHPNDVLTSFVTEGIISYLLSIEGLDLREQFYFKILPMMNPDGVIHGNSLTNLQGIDINQKWHKVNKLVPSAQHVKAILKKNDKLFLVLDLHQTFKKYGITFIGRHDKKLAYVTAAANCCPYINLEQSKFGKSSKMEKTLPFALGDYFNCIYQVKISSQIESGKDFNINNLKEIGMQLCQALKFINKYETPQLQHYQEISESESCESFEENIIKKKILKKKTGSFLNENQPIITKKTLPNQRLKPLKPLCEIQQHSTKKSVQSQFKTRIRSFSTRTTDMKH